MAPVRHFFSQRDAGANELQWDERPPDTEKPVPGSLVEKSLSEAPERSRNSAGFLKPCNMPTLVVHDESQAEDTRSRQPETSESFSLATGGDGDADIRDNPAQPNEHAPAERQKNIAAKPADASSSASSRESASSFGTVVAHLYQQVFYTAGSEKPFVCDWGNPVQTTSTDFTQSSFPLTDGKGDLGTGPKDAGANKVTATKTQELKQDCSNKSLKSSANEEGGKVPEVIADQSSNKSDVLNTVLEDRVHPQTLGSLNFDLSTPILFNECLNLPGEAQGHNITNDLRGQRPVGRAQDPLLKQPCAQIKTSTEIEISLQPLDRARECFESDSGADGLKSQSFFGKFQNENVERMFKCRPVHGDAGVKQDKESTTCEETNANDDFEHRRLCQTPKTDVHALKIEIEKEENIVSTEEEQELSFTIKDTEISEDLGAQMESTESEIKDNTLIATITAAGGKDKNTQGLQATVDNQTGKKWAEKDRKGAEEGSLKSPSTSQEEKTAEPSTKREDAQEKMELEKDTFQVNTKRDVLEQEAMTEKEFIAQSNNGDDHKAQEVDEHVEDKNPDARGNILVNVTTQIESMAINEQENDVRRSDGRLNLTDNMAENVFFASVNDVQHKQESDKENTGEGQSANTANEMLLHKEKAFHNNTIVVRDISKAVGDEPEHTLEWPCAWVDEPESDPLSLDNTSSESDSDDEVELYMHCLRAVHGRTQVRQGNNRDAGSNTVKSMNRGKPLSTPMPSISESVEEQPQCWQQDSNEEMAEIHTKAAALPVTSEQRDASRNVSRWDSLNCGNVSKTLLYATMLVSFVFVAFYYDFLACFGLYIISIIWLCCQGERQSGKNNRLG